MTKRPWSLARRLTLLFVAGTLLLVLGNSAVSAYFVHTAVERQLVALTIEELDEIEAYFVNSDRTIESFRDASEKLRKKHEGTPTAWRVWDPTRRQIWGEFGDVSLLAADVPALEPSDETRTGPRELRWRTKQISTAHVVGVVVDGKPQLELIDRYDRLWIARIAITVALALAMSWFFMHNATRLLRQVVEDVRSDSEPPLDARGAPVEIRAVANALRERLARVKLEAQKAQLFTASLAHELRSPIQNLVGETEVALITPRDADTYRKVLESHLHELRELGDAIDNLLSIVAKRESDSKLLRQEFDLAEEAEIRLAREKSRARISGVSLELHREGDTRIFGDREALLRALRNLAANAIEWSPPGSKVEIQFEGHNGEVVVTVDDQGPGVPAEIRERIFEPFFTGPPKQGGRLGYGLGLAIARSAAMAHGGAIEVETSASGGARFRLVLPRHPRPATPVPK